MEIKIPNHIAIIMDGNGRWAQSRGLPRTAGHKRGAESARNVVEHAAELGVSYVTLFGFSSENWNRPASEIKEIMLLLRHYLRAETAELHRKNARLRVIGSRAELDKDIVRLIENAEELTKDNDAITVIIALNYGGRQDILNACKSAVKNLDKNASDLEIELAFEEGISTFGIPDPELLIRTSGEQRISNFLLWQCAYSEFVFTETHWPDFGREDLEAAIQEYTGRDRRFGAIKASEL